MDRMRVGVGALKAGELAGRGGLLSILCLILGSNLYLLILEFYSYQKKGK